tara:strand:+ start:204 stop:1127 length:924 start_codon:yes stop_codon:yes gene_type:complete
MKKILLALLVALTITGCDEFTVSVDEDSKQVINDVVDSITNKQSGKTRLFFIYGQSNGSGSAYDIDTEVSITGEIWDTQLKAPATLVDPTRYDGEYYGSAWPTFATEYNKITGDKVIILNASFGGRKMSELAEGSHINGRAMTWLNEALEYYGDEIDSLSMVFVHGESDAAWNTNKDEYFRDLAALSNQVSLMSPVYDTTYIHRVGISRDPQYDESRQLKFLEFGDEMIARTVDRPDWKPAFIKAPLFSQQNGLKSHDYVHYSMNGYKVMARSMALNISKYNKGLNIKSALIEESAALTKSLKVKFQ